MVIALDAGGLRCFCDGASGVYSFRAVNEDLLSVCWMYLRLVKKKKARRILLSERYAMFLHYNLHFIVGR